MAVLLVVGGGLFGSMAAACGRRKGLQVLVFDPGLPGAASPAAAGLFKESWAGAKLRNHFLAALPLLEALYGIRQIHLTHPEGVQESFLFVPPTSVLEKKPIREEVLAVGDGWLETTERRYEGWVYVAAGIWCERFFPDLEIVGKAGASFLFSGEREGVIVPIGRGRQAIAFVRDPGMTHFSDGTAETEYLPEHDELSLQRARSLGLTEKPLQRLWGIRPYTRGGPVFRKVASRTWLATGGRKMGTILAASFARRLIEDELS